MCVTRILFKKDHNHREGEREEWSLTDTRMVYEDVPLLSFYNSVREKRI